MSVCVMSLQTGVMSNAAVHAIGVTKRGGRSFYEKEKAIYLTFN